METGNDLAFESVSPEGERLQNVCDNQKVINDILRLSIDPHLAGGQLEHILDYLFTIPRLHLLPMAGIFLVDQQSRKLVLTTHRGFSGRQKKKCGEVPFGICHCGEAARLGKASFSGCDSASSGINCGQAGKHGHLCLPIIRDSLLIGVVCFYVSGGQRCYAEEELLGSICHIMGGILEAEVMDSQLINLVNDLNVTIVNLRDERKFSESIIQGLSHGLLVVDQQGNIQKSNSVAGSILRPFALTLEGENLFDILGHEAAGQMMQERGSLDLQGERENELSLTTMSGEKRVVGSTTIARNDAKGRRIGLIISLTDISEIKYVRREMEKMNRLATVAEIAAAVAHEVRNPLAGIKIMAQSIEEQSVTMEEQRECAGRIVRQVDRLNELLTEFFSYARPAAPKTRPVSIIDILSETRHLIGNKLSNKNIIVTDDHQENLPRVVVDPHQLQQVFLNLFLNAIDAVQRGGIIAVTTMQLSALDLDPYKRKYPGLLSGSHYVRLCFSDNGAGMSPETVEKAFEPFYTTKTVGAGLGLSIVYRTLKENDAAIIIDSTEGRGATFTIFFRISA